jgi:hypothetical protein
MAQITSGLTAGESVVTGTVAARTGSNSNSGTGGINVNSLTGGGGFGGGGFR